MCSFDELLCCFHEAFSFGIGLKPQGCDLSMFEPRFCCCDITFLTEVKVMMLTFTYREYSSVMTSMYFPFGRCPKFVLTSVFGAVGKGNILRGSFVGVSVKIWQLK